MASEPTQTQRGAARLSLTLLVTMVVGLLVAVEGSSPGDVSEPVVASAYGYRAYGISLSGVSQPDTGPTPTASLPAGGAGGVQEGRAYTGTVAYGPAELFTSDDIVVTASATLGPGGSVRAESHIENANKSTRQATGLEILAASAIVGRVVVDESGTHATTTITNGSYDVHSRYTNCTSQTAVCDGHTHPDPNPAGTVAIPTNPPPNSKVAGHVHLSDTSTYDYVVVFNEQVAGSDGSLTLNPVHEIFGATLDGSDNIVPDPPYNQGGSILQGDLILGQVIAGGTVTASTTTTTAQSTTTTTAQSTTTTTAQSTTTTTAQARTTTTHPSTSTPQGPPPVAGVPTVVCSLVAGLFRLPIVGPVIASVMGSGCPAP